MLFELEYFGTHWIFWFNLVSYGAKSLFAPKHAELLNAFKQSGTLDKRTFSGSLQGSLCDTTHVFAVKIRLERGIPDHNHTQRKGFQKQQRYVLWQMFAQKREIYLAAPVKAFVWTRLTTVEIWTLITLEILCLGYCCMMPTKKYNLWQIFESRVNLRSVQAVQVKACV